MSRFAWLKQSQHLYNVLIHDSFFPTFDFFSVNLHFLLPYIIMDLPIFVIAEWATLLVNICCPRGGS